MTTEGACRLLAETLLALRAARAQIVLLEEEQRIEREIRSVALEQLAGVAADLEKLRRANRTLREELRRYTAAAVLGKRAA